MENQKDFAGLIRKAGKAQRTDEFSCPYIKDFKVEIAYASKFVLNQIREVAREIHGNPRTGQKEERLNEDKLRDEYARQIIRGWSGLTPAKLQDILPGVEYGEADRNRQIEFSQDVAVALLEASLEFEAWVIDIATEVQNFKHVAERQEELEENLA
jgi:hypothetical protein